MINNPVPAGAADAPASRLTILINDLSGVLNGLERASLQYENMLLKIRGSHPATEAPSPAPGHLEQAEPPTMTRLQTLGDRLQQVADKLNNQADELREYI